MRSILLWTLSALDDPPSSNHLEAWEKKQLRSSEEKGINSGDSAGVNAILPGVLFLHRLMCGQTLEMSNSGIFLET